jgi:UDP-3-O-acyl-N-acetylglucosamine deacetylase
VHPVVSTQCTTFTWTQDVAYLNENGTLGGSLFDFQTVIDQASLIKPQTPVALARQ